MIKDMEIIHLIQLPTRFHENKDAADSTAFFFFILGGAAWERWAQAPARMEQTEKQTELQM